MGKCLNARTQKEQNAIKPKEAVQMLKTGNKNFVNDHMTKYCYGKMAKQSAKNGQFPFAAVVACVDSRIPVEQVFDQGIGDLFVARVAGNFVNTDIVGSLEFAVLSGVKSILILGHTSCGAVKGACDGATGHPALDHMLSNIQPAVRSAMTSTGKIATSTDSDFVNAVSHINVKLAMADLRNKSAIINSAIQNGDLELIGGMYNLKTRVAKIADDFMNESF